MAETSEISGSLVPLARREAMILLEAGYLWLDMGQFDKAREIFAGAALLMPRSEVPQLALGSLEFSKLLVEKAEVAVAPGMGFGEHGEQAVRIAIVENEHRIRQAARNIKKFLSSPPDSLHNVIPMAQKASR